MRDRSIDINVVEVRRQEFSGESVFEDLPCSITIARAADLAGPVFAIRENACFCYRRVVERLPYRVRAGLSDLLDRGDR